MFDELGIGELVDELVPQDLSQRKISVGQALKAMVLNGLGFANRRLYLMPEFFRNKAAERLGLGSGVATAHLDTTSFHVDGRYNSECDDLDENAGVIHVSKGYSRDHRDDLDQVVLELITESRANLP